MSTYKHGVKAKNKSQKHTTGGIPRWSPTLVLVARFSAYVWQSGRDAQFSLTYGRMCLRRAMNVISSYNACSTDTRRSNVHSVKARRTNTSPQKLHPTSTNFQHRFCGLVRLSLSPELLLRRPEAAIESSSATVLRRSRSWLSSPSEPACTSHSTLAYAATKNGHTAHLHGCVYKGASVLKLACERRFTRSVVNLRCVASMNCGRGCD